MLRKFEFHFDKVLRFCRLKPLSLGEKCRLQFGLAILFVLTIALSIPYMWMGRLSGKILLDSGRNVADTVYERHFQIGIEPDKALPVLREGGEVADLGEASVKWVRMEDESTGWAEAAGLSKKHVEAIENLVEQDLKYDFTWLEARADQPRNHYVRVVRVEDSCMTCHFTEGSASAFNKSQIVGAIVVEMPEREMSKTAFMNLTVTLVAYTLAMIGAMVAFYTIAQRIILRPIRQLRALVNNIAEGNLDARSAIKSNDEYERLSDALNHMMDGLQESQQKLRTANAHLDGNIAELSERNIELFKANKLKSEFLANMSHEFRTPLNSILGFAQLVKERVSSDPEKSKRYAENIVSSGRSLLNMINDLLDLAKAEAGKMELRIEKTGISQLCQGLLAFFSPMTEQKMIIVSVTVADDIPLIQTDTGKVQQILYNLLSNAIKFTPEHGKITINAKMLNDTMVRISVTDTGPGIAASHQENIFEKFRQLDGSITRSSEGTGLGLAISKELTHLLAGNISVESDPGAGATFHLDVPIALAEPEAEEPTEV
jgi:two-component system sensor histidine kinase BarA